jgi:hypothetical protein
MKAAGAESGCTGFTLKAPKQMATRPGAARAQRPGRRAVPRPDPSVDPRARLAAREQRLLVREIAQLERLLAAMRPKDPQRAQVIRRLAEGFAELARAAERRVVAAELRAEAEEQRQRKAAQGRGDEGTAGARRGSAKPSKPERSPRSVSPYQGSPRTVW